MIVTVSVKMYRYECDVCEKIFEAKNSSSIFTFTRVKDTIFQPNIPSNIQIYINYDPGLETQSQLVTLSIKSYICKGGKLCGLVKKYGRTLRDPICHEVQNGLSYLGVYDENGLLKGPDFHFLIGDSVLYNPSINYPTQDGAYFYYSAPFAIRGSFDQNKQLVKLAIKV